MASKKLTFYRRLNYALEDYLGAYLYVYSFLGVAIAKDTQIVLMQIKSILPTRSFPLKQFNPLGERYRGLSDDVGDNLDRLCRAIYPNLDSVVVRFIRWLFIKKPK